MCFPPSRVGMPRLRPSRTGSRKEIIRGMIKSESSIRWCKRTKAWWGEEVHQAHHISFIYPWSDLGLTVSKTAVGNAERWHGCGANTTLDITSFSLRAPHTTGSGLGAPGALGMILMIGGGMSAADFDWAGRRELVGQFTRFINLGSGSCPRGDGGAAAFFFSVCLGPVECVRAPRCSCCLRGPMPIDTVACHFVKVQMGCGVPHSR